ncbi:hypothetical protein AVEN_107807-1 [Araneus ventricosus]|uniref:Uncharacterized protein n=1 Tax=Araneus ventricosus TaxID=182803 RepID=A0A4Y2Q314_ARAVE|nr:hypothetical protein AVEN_107807-1 [Araneus ventricosus]
MKWVTETKEKLEKVGEKDAKNIVLKRSVIKKLEDNILPTNPVPGPSRDSTICRRRQLEVDSPVTQNRNRKMFYLIATFLAPELGVAAFNWHYTESGYDNGAPEGVGGCLKRIADLLVGRGKDINRHADELAANSKKNKCD